MTDKLANLALMGGNAELLEAAEFYKDLPGHADKAVMLYHKVWIPEWKGEMNEYSTVQLPTEFNSRQEW